MQGLDSRLRGYKSPGHLRANDQGAGKADAEVFGEGWSGGEVGEKASSARVLSRAASVPLTAAARRW